MERNLADKSDLGAGLIIFASFVNWISRSGNISDCPQMVTRNLISADSLATIAAHNNA